MKTKKLLALLIAAVMVLGVLPMGALADSEELEVDWSAIEEPVEFGSFPIVSFTCNTPSRPRPRMFIDGEQYPYILFWDVEDDVYTISFIIKTVEAGEHSIYFTAEYSTGSYTDGNVEWHTLTSEEKTFVVKDPAAGDTPLEVESACAEFSLSGAEVLDCRQEANGYTEYDEEEFEYTILLSADTPADAEITVFLNGQDGQNTYIRGMNYPFWIPGGEYVDPDESGINGYLDVGACRQYTVQLEDGEAYYPFRLEACDEDESYYSECFQFHFTRDNSLFEETQLINAEAEIGQFENINTLLSDYMTYLVVPYGTSSADVTLTIGDAFDGVRVNGGEKVSVDEDGQVTVTLTAEKYGADNIITFTKESGDTNVVYNIVCTEQKYSGMPDRVVEYLCIGSQYTNGEGLDDYGLRPVRSLVGSNFDAGGARWTDENGIGRGGSGPVSLGGWGGYITYYYENAITDDPNNPYGVDFITFGNSVEGSNEFGEPGQVWVSEDGETWYALAGGMHYEDYAVWDYSVTYQKNEEGLSEQIDQDGNVSFVKHAWPDAAHYPYYQFGPGEDQTITIHGINFKPGGVSEFGNLVPPFAGFGYTDMGAKGTVFEGENYEGLSLEEVAALASRNIAGNPYLGTYMRGVREFSAVTDGMDLAWAVDTDGQPVTFENGIHYVKIVTASNIEAGAIGEKSCEVNMVRIAQANDEPVGKTDAPAKITVDGIELALEEGKFVYDDVPVDGPFKVAVDAPEDAHIYINNKCAADVNYDGMPLHKIVRVIVQEGEKEPVIYILNLKETASAAAPAATLTLDANGGTINGNATYSIRFDANMSGDPLPEPSGPYWLEFAGWYMGQRRFDAIPDEIQDITLKALWIPKETTPTTETIDVTFRLIGSTLATGDIDLADGDYKGAEYVTWIPTTTYTVDENATVADLFIKATNAAGIRSVGADRGYVSTVYAPDVLGGYALSEFTNGPKSGWMYTMDGAHTNAINTQTMHDGAEIVFHYVNDYAWEVEDWSWLGGSGWPQLSDEDANYWNKWLEAADVAPYVPPVDPEPDDPTPTEPTEPEPEPKKYEDVAEDAWYAGAVDFVSARGLFLGVSETKFGPELPMTRAMLVTVLWRMEGQPAPGAAAAFEDVPAGQWYADAVAWAAENGIVKGVGHNRYAPDENVTREQFAAMLYRYAHYKGEGFTGAWYFPLAFEDAAEISDWADEAMHWCVMNGVITGRTETTLVPRGDAKRAEAAAMLERFAGLLEK